MQALKISFLFQLGERFPAYLHVEVNGGNLRLQHQHYISGLFITITSKLSVFKKIYFKYRNVLHQDLDYNLQTQL